MSNNPKRGRDGGDDETSSKRRVVSGPNSFLPHRPTPDEQQHELLSYQQQLNTWFNQMSRSKQKQLALEKGYELETKELSHEIKSTEVTSAVATRAVVTNAAAPAATARMAAVTTAALVHTTATAPTSPTPDSRSGALAAMVTAAAGKPQALAALSGAVWEFARYVGFPSVPNYIADIKSHPSEYYDAKKYCTQALTFLQLVVPSITAWAEDLFNKMNKPQDYDRFFNHWLSRLNYPQPLALQAPKTTYDATYWLDDIQWAKRFIAGPNPLLIQYIKQNNDKRAWCNRFGITSADRFDYNIIIPINDDSQLNKFNIYIVDYRDLLNATYQSNMYLSAPLVLLTSQNGELIPLAIQFRGCQQPEIPTTPIIIKNIPNKNQQQLNRWIFAKFIVGNADSNYHEVVSHLGFTHLLIEPIAVAAHQVYTNNQSDPLFQLLLPHFHRTMFVNEAGRGTLISDQPGPASLDMVTSLGVKGSKQLINDMYARRAQNNKKDGFYDIAHFPTCITNRSFDLVDQNNGLNHYYYRDYGMMVWQCIETYVTQAIDTIYPNEPSLQAQLKPGQLLYKFLDTCRNPNLGNLPSFPQITNKQELCKLVTSIIWTASAQHAAVNFEQYDHYAFSPNSPLILNMNMSPTDSFDPDHLLNLSDSDLALILPKLQNQLSILSVASILVINNKQDDYYLTTPADWQSKVPFPKLYQQFFNDLKKKQDIMEKRNAQYGSHYVYLYPDNIPASISV